MGIFLMMRLFPSAKAKVENAINRIRKTLRFAFGMKVSRLPMVVMCPFQFMNRPLESNLTCEPEIYLSAPRGCGSRLCFSGPDVSQLVGVERTRDGSRIAVHFRGSEPLKVSRKPDRWHSRGCDERHAMSSSSFGQRYCSQVQRS